MGGEIKARAICGGVDFVEGYGQIAARQGSLARKI
jgi:hypothetical protein